MSKLRSFKLCPFNERQLITNNQISCDISLGVQIKPYIELTDLDIIVTGFKPKPAASKAFSKILKLYNISESQQIKFSIIETTKNSEQRQFYFCGERTKLDEPHTIKIGNKEREPYRLRRATKGSELLPAPLPNQSN